jgi:hypothetical protein
VPNLASCGSNPAQNTITVKTVANAILVIISRQLVTAPDQPVAPTTMATARKFFDLIAWRVALAESKVASATRRTNSKFKSKRAKTPV